MEDNKDKKRNKKKGKIKGAQKQAVEFLNESLLMEDDATSAKKSPWASFNQMGRYQKISTIIKSIFFIASLVLVVMTFISYNLWPDSLLAKIFYMPDVPSYERVVVGLLATVFYIVLFIVSAEIIKSVIYLAVPKQDARAVTIAKMSGSALRYIAIIISLFVCLSVWGVDTATILASAGIVAMIIGLGAQTLFADILAGVNIIIEDQFRIGDIVVIDNFRGTVVEIGLVITKIKDWAGNIKNIHNGGFNSCINLSRINSYATSNVSVDYDTDLKKLRNILETNLPNLSKKIPAIIGNAMYMGVSGVEDSGIVLLIIAKCKEDDRFGVARRLNEELVILLKENDVTIPFPQVTISQREAKKEK
ncbi:MAG: mechanosensitive ion channel family protein [Bacilli bacterium]|nr:mechanosensitive ion channel family protein [Bacilli bacterium]